MLKSLYISNYALIDRLEMDFGPGFSVITGETGAGKSIILGALSLILGQRADTKSIKQGEQKCVIEGIFDVKAYDLKSFCEESGIEYDADSYILRREILANGKSRAFINDSPVSLTDLKELGGLLIDIHSQHQNLMLGDSRFQMQVVDIIAGTMRLLKEYQAAYKEYKDAEKTLADLQEQALKSKDDEDYIRYQYTALAEAKLIDGEQTVLEQEQETLTHAEDIKSALYKIHVTLSDDDRGVIPALKEGLNTAQNLTKIFNKANDISARIESAYIDLRELSSEAERYAGDVEFNPERLAFIEERLSTLYTLQQKHRVASVAELLDIQAELEAKLNSIDSFDEQIAALQKNVNQKQETALALAKDLSKKRMAATKQVEKQLTEKIAYLGMPNVRFECRMEEKKHLDISGIDQLRFMFSANKNAPLQPVANVASGGEISRVMLCLKSMIAGAAALPTIIFDEIDTGVSGEVADRMGRVMQDFGNQMQVIAITHLPQIAAKGEAHYYVYKQDDKDSTTTNLRLLTQEERIEELAQMLSGAQITDTARQNAKEMLEEK
ncbi:DNA repair protein RecN (Recombination protein N) [Dysgonomonas sp. PH5-45]|uniref:DNA repair protein RecN n=1 Tax=unclassified Dysgonomonas TaxID=2630389 RepID=UPI0024764DB3|nr:MULTISPECIES: DNA repair protein RecN [unclassified Dysgonomonas]MDH6354228.1 DNA repair protein RecN (Recombination protein N) [Dysgonomonas sp. PH5-45]MDH6387129.1 DNA repair protein RecN (Recombination protein N) [Dysgonomonas sp. PH5-37]